MAVKILDFSFFAYHFHNLHRSWLADVHFTIRRTVWSFLYEGDKKIRKKIFENSDRIIIKWLQKFEIQLNKWRTGKEVINKPFTNDDAGNNYETFITNVFF